MGTLPIESKMQTLLESAGSPLGAAMQSGMKSFWASAGAALKKDFAKGGYYMQLLHVEPKSDGSGLMVEVLSRNRDTRWNIEVVLRLASDRAAVFSQDLMVELDIGNPAESRYTTGPSKVVPLSQVTPDYVVQWFSGSVDEP